MTKIEREVSGLYVNLPSSNKDRLKTNAFSTNIAIRSCFAALPNRANCSQIFFIEPILVAFNNDTIWVNLEGYVRGIPIPRSPFERVVIGVLEQLKYKASTTSIYVLRKTMSSSQYI